LMSLLKIAVHVVLPGITNHAYVPADTGLPSIFTSRLNVTLVAALAPARHSLSYGTRLPKIFRPFTPGDEYSTVMSVRPTVWVTFAFGLKRGRSTVCADASEARIALQASARERMAVFMCMVLLDKLQAMVHQCASVSGGGTCRPRS